jgi:hypothetical protein
MSGVTITIWGGIVAVGVFIVVGVIVVIGALRPDPATRAARRAAGAPRTTFEEGVRNYVGPVTGDMALLTPPTRVLLEFVGALCGFPGFGWMMSTRVAIGLPLLVVVPSVLFGFYPAALAVGGRLAQDPYVTLRLLPFLAVASAGSLAAVEARGARRPTGVE